MGGTNKQVIALRRHDTGRISKARWIRNKSRQILQYLKMCLDRSKAICIAKTGKAHLKLWCVGSKLDKGTTGAAVVWEDNAIKKWQQWKLCLGLNKEIFDAKMWSISEAFKIAEKKAMKVQEPWVINIFCDLQTIINNLCGK